MGERGQRTKLSQEVEQLKASLSNVIADVAAVKGYKLLSIALQDVVGNWFVTGSNVRVTVTGDGTCRYNSGAADAKITLASATLTLSNNLTLSQAKSSRKVLVWEEGGGNSQTW